MAVAIASTSTAQSNGDDTLVINAPTAIDEGDLLLLVVASGTFNEDVTSTGFTNSLVSVPTTLNSQRGGFNVLYKIATLADESETNYTISGATDNYLGLAVMYRVTGWSTSDPLYFSTSNIQTLGQSDAVIDETISTIRPTAQLNFIVASAFSDDAGLNGELAMQDFELVSGDSNPSWTTNSVSSRLNPSQGWYGKMVVAHSNSTDTSDVTGYKFTYNETSLDDPASGAFGYFMIASPSDASGSNTLITTTSSAFDGSGVTNVSGSNTLTEATAVPLAQGGKSETRIWDNETKPSTNWNNETK